MIGYIKYGDVVLDCTRVNRVHRNVLTDSAGNYYCTEWTISLVAVWNPGATSYATLNAGGVPQAGNAFAGRTDRLLHAYLSQPRRQLRLLTYDVDGSRRIYLESPPNFHGSPLPSDVKNGPIVKVISVIETMGVKCYEVALDIQTWINDCYDKTSPIITHSFETTVDYDQDHFQTNTTRGEILLNAGRLRDAGQSPDMYREQLFVAPHPNFARDHVNVSVAPDGCSASYTVVDVERPFNLGTQSPATRLEAKLTTWVEHGAFINAVAQTSPQISNTIWNNAPTVGETVFGPAGMAMWMARIGRNNINTGTALAGNLVAQLPKYCANFRARAHGGRTSKRFDLARLCLALARTWLGDPRFFSLAQFTELMLAQDVAGTPFVELDMTLSWTESLAAQLAGIAGPVGSVGFIFGSAFSADSRAQQFMSSYFCNRNGTVRSQDFAGLQVNGEPFGDPRLNVTQQPVGNRPMNTGEEKINGLWANPKPASPFRHTRGPGSLEYILAAALLGQCETPESNPRWTASGIPGQANPSNGIFTVPAVPITLLQNDS